MGAECDEVHVDFIVRDLIALCTQSGEYKSVQASGGGGGGLTLSFTSSCIVRLTFQRRADSSWSDMAAKVVGEGG